MKKTFWKVILSYIREDIGYQEEERNFEELDDALDYIFYAKDKKEPQLVNINISLQVLFTKGDNTYEIQKLYHY